MWPCITHDGSVSPTFQCCALLRTLIPEDQLLLLILHLLLQHMLVSSCIFLASLLLFAFHIPFLQDVRTVMPRFIHSW